MEKLKGRQVIYTNETEINIDNICDVIKKAMSIHTKNSKEVIYLDEYEKGVQEILTREKKVRPEINNKIVENHAHEIVDFKVSYVFGSPITYVQRASKDSKEVSENIDTDNLTLFNEMLFEQGKFYKDQELATWFNKTGVGYRCILPNKSKDEISPFIILNMNPATTFVIRSNDIYKKVIAGVSYTVDEDDNYIYGIYTNEKVFTGKGSSTEISKSNITEEVNGIGMIPIIEYINDYERMCSFERVIHLLNAINSATSDRINGLEQFIQSLIWFNNIDIDEEQFESLASRGGIKTKSTDGLVADIKQIVTNLNQTEVQTLLDYLNEQVKVISGIPGREQSTGGNTGQAIMLGGSGWQLAETSAKKTELIFSQADREMLKVIDQVIKNSNSKLIKEINVRDIEIKFSRNKTSNLLTKTQGLANQLASGIHPRVAIANCDLYSDPEQVYQDSKDYLAKWLQVKSEEKQIEEEPTKEIQQEVETSETDNQ